MNSKLAILASAIITATCVQAAKQLVDGYTWEYTVANGEATVLSCEPQSGHVTIPLELGGVPVKTIGAYSFSDKSGYASVTIPEGVRKIEGYAFYNARIRVSLPSSVTYIGDHGVSACTITRWNVAPSFSYLNGYSVSMSMGECELILNYDIPSTFLSGKGSTETGVASWGYVYPQICQAKSFVAKRSLAAKWMLFFGSEAKFAGYIDDMPEVEIVSSAMRKDDPTVMDVVYKVHSSAQTVKVRAMAWENGERNLSKAIRPTKWIEGTEANIGDAVTANEEHKLSWRIAGDWATDLSKVKIEVLAVEDDLLPLELQTIPQTATHQKMKISWNKMTADHVFDALLWLYADGDAGLTLVNGQLKNGANLLASGTSLYNSETAVGYVFGKMGYQKLAGDELAYARRVTQLELPVSGVQQFAVKYPDAK